MTIRQIVDLINFFDEEEMINHSNYKPIHKIYSIEEEWCYITSKSGARLKLTPDLPNSVVYEAINQVILNNK